MAATRPHEQLTNRLQQQLTELDGLQQALDAELDALRSADPQTLDDATAAKTQCLERVQAQQQSLVAECQACGFDGDSEDLATWLRRLDDASGHLSHLLFETRELARACAQLNQRNGAVIEGTRWYVAEALNSVVAADTTGAGVYGADGARSGPGQHYIGKA